jgi:MarR family transcriptional regulator, 2-MHQ and catechol-resistance regulon repressor
LATHYEGTSEETQALDAYSKLVRSTEAVTTRIHRHLNTVDLTISQFGVLEALYFLGPLCQSALAAKILRSGGNMTLVIDNLEKTGLVRRERDAKDRRYITVSLTEPGKKLIAEIFPEHAKAVMAEMSTLSLDEQQLLEHLCRKLGKADCSQIL